MQYFLVTFLLKSEFSSLDLAYYFYTEDLLFQEIVQREFVLRKEKWNKTEVINLSKTAICSLGRCDDYFFSLIIIPFYKLLVVLPVSVAAVERGFSNLRKLKLYLNNTTSKPRTSGFVIYSPTHSCKQLSSSSDSININFLL